MESYNSLVKALRLCQFGECGCGKCYYKELKGDWCTEDNHPEFFDCDDKLKLDAAAAIEALEAEVEELKSKKMKLAENSLRFVGEVRELDKRRLQPKRGEWVLQASGQDCKCSACGAYWIPFGDEYDYKFCPNCGAKMEEKC